MKKAQKKDIIRAQKKAISPVVSLSELKRMLKFR